MENFQNLMVYEKPEKADDSLLKKKRNHSKHDIFEEKPSLKSKINNLYDQYSKSFEYFKKNENYKMSDDSRKKLLTLKNLMKRLNSDEKDTITDSEIPEEVNSEYICQCSKEERMKTFKLIIDDYKRRIEKLKEQNKDTKPLRMMLLKILEMSKNEFVPPPLFILNEEEKEEKINKDIEENFINLIAENYLGINKDMFIKVSLSNNETSTKELQFNNDLNTEHTFEVSSKEYRFLYKRELLVNLYRYRFYTNKIRQHCCWPFNVQNLGKLSLPLKSFQNHCEIKGFYPITNLTNSKKNYFLKLDLKIRKAIVEKEFLSKSETYINIIKVFPPFSME